MLTGPDDHLLLNSRVNLHWEHWIQSGKGTHKAVSFIRQPRPAPSESAKEARVFEMGVEEQVADRRYIVGRGTVDKGWLWNKLTLVLVFSLLRPHKQCVVPCSLSVLYCDRVVSMWVERTASTNAKRCMYGCV